ncbi:hypothetical protein HDV06_001141 [Boothiomyces sp. JEL0866]|nr:hypothetical protein HDV06_001141 [Boothiomyces sp. JEL0866]
MQLQIICVNDPSKSKQIEINETQSIFDLKQLLYENEAEQRLIYQGKLLQNEMIVSEIVKKDEAFVHLVLKKSEDDITPTLESTQQTPTEEKVEQKGKEPSRGISLESSFTLYPIIPKLIVIDGTLYVMHSGESVYPNQPANIATTFRYKPNDSMLRGNYSQHINRQPENQPQIPQVELPQPLQPLQPAPAQPAARPLRVQVMELYNQFGDSFWLLVKLTVAVWFFTQNTSTFKTILISTIAVILFLFQSGLVAFPDVQQQNRQDAPVTLLGLVIHVVISFVSSLVPENIPN